MDNIIDGVRTYIAACPLLSEITVKNRHIDFTDDSDGNYGIMVDGDEPISNTMRGGGEREYVFTLYIRKMAVDDVHTLQNTQFIERLQKWCKTQSRQRRFPVLPFGCQPLKITAEKGMLIDLGTSKKSGTYQIQFKLNYYEK